MKNSKVVDMWLSGRSASAKNLTTDGRDLWSYSLLIGFTEEGQKVVVDRTARSGAFVSQTTSCHVGLAKRGADEVISPSPR